jgi:hypothetical protein
VLSATSFTGLIDQRSLNNYRNKQFIHRVNTAQWAQIANGWEYF